MEHVRHWFDSMMMGLETLSDEETRKRLLEHCGRACARRETIAAVKKTLEGTAEGGSLGKPGDGTAGPAVMLPAWTAWTLSSRCSIRPFAGRVRWFARATPSP